MTVTINGTTGIDGPNASGDTLINGVTVGTGAGDVSSNTAVGVNALASNTTGSNNVSVGANALDANTTGIQNTAIGSGAIGSATTADSNTAVGYLALRDSTTGAENSALGVAALLSNTTGANNTALGRSALLSNTTASNNTAVGYQALTANTTATGNTAVGYQAGDSITTGEYNTVLGFGAGRDLTTGTLNTFVGVGFTSPSGSLVTTGSKNTILGGYNGNQDGLDIRTASNYIVLSDGDGNPRAYWNNHGAFVNVISGSTAEGFGTSPVSQFVNGNSNSYTLVVGNDAASPASQYVQDIRFIGSTPNNTNARFLACTDATNEKAAILSTGGFLSRNNSYGTYSDIKLKENIVDATPKLDDVLNLQVRNFNFKSDPDEKQIGFIAQEFEQVFPSMVEESQDRDQDGNVLDTTTKSIKTSVLVPILVKAIQELSAQVTALQAEVNALKGAE